MQRTYHLLILMVVSMLACCFCFNVAPALLFSPAELPQARVGQPYSVAITISGNRTPVDQIWLENGVLPSGLVMQYDEGANVAEISGTPEEDGMFEFTVGASCLGTNVSGQTGQQHYELLVR
jgi:hypothetical protein